MMRRLTVGIPVFNAMPYLPESLESILRQDFADFEILVINDGSTDGSLEYLRSIDDPRLRVVTQPNQGLTATLNRMLAEIDTPWLVRMDADDVALPHRLAAINDHIEKFPNAAMFHSLAEYYPRQSVGLFRSTKSNPAQIRSLVQSGFLPSICHPTVTLNVEKARSLGGYRFNLHVEDIDLWWRMALAYDIQLIPQITLGFRQNHASVSSLQLESQAVNTLYVQYLLLSHLWNREPLPYEQVRQPLSDLLDGRDFRSKTHLRAFNMALAKRRPLAALGHAAAALAASPSYFCGRFLDEFFSNRSIAIGEPPATWLHHHSKLWTGPAPIAELAGGRQASANEHKLTSAGVPATRKGVLS